MCDYMFTFSFPQCHSIVPLGTDSRDSWHEKPPQTVNQSADLWARMRYLFLMIKLPELGERLYHRKVDCSIVCGYSPVNP